MKKFKVGLQLYSVREEMERDMDAALRAIKEFGYDYVEFAGYFGHSSKEVRELLDKHGLECISVHQGYEAILQNEKESIEYIKAIGAKYCVVPWMGKEKQKGTELFDLMVKELAQVGKALKENGIQLLYHNHDFEFERFNDVFLLDWLYEAIPSDILQTEIDTCWVRYAGYDPAEYIQKYAGRSPIVHLKDFVCEASNAGSVYKLIDNLGKEIKKGNEEESGFMFKPLGSGIQNFPAILNASEKAGVEYIIVEQDSSVEQPQMEAAKMSREYLKSLGL